MRILTFLHTPNEGGVERTAMRLVARWRQLGIEAPLYLGTEENALRHRSRAASPCYSMAAKGATARMIAALPAVIRREQPDVLFCAGNTYAVVAAAMKLLLGRRCPPILAKVSNDLDRVDLPRPARLAYHLWLRMLGCVLDHLIAMEEPAREEVRDRLAIPDDRISVISDPVLLPSLLRCSPRPEQHGPGGSRRFVMAGRLAKQKNVSLALRAFRKGSRPGDRLTIIGDGPERQRLLHLTSCLDLEGRVTFVGQVAEAAALLHSHDILLVSSDYEGVPAVVIEALASNLGLIVTDCSRSMGTVLLGGRLGALVPCRDEAALAAAIARAMPGSADPAAARSQAQRFSLERGADAYLAAAEACLGNDLTPKGISRLRRAIPGWRRTDREYAN